MAPKYLRLAYLVEFFVAVLAIFTAWSEIGGQAALDLMPWGWKAGLGLGLSAAAVGYTSAAVNEETRWNARTAKWLSLICAIVLGMGLVTYFYVLQEDSTDTTGDQENVTSFNSQCGPFPLPIWHSRPV
jgi:hypothetical protein